MQRCNELEAELAELRALYESYFMGNERIPPLKQHDAFKKAYLKLKGASVRQTAVKFRVESIGQKLLTFERLWDRTLKEIEAGTYKRDLARLKRHQKPKRAGAAADFHIDEDLDLSDLDADEGGADELAAAMAAAEAAAEARAKPPPAIAPLVPAIAPLSPAAGVKPATGPVPGIKPAAGAAPAVTPAGAPRPALTPSAGVKPLVPAAAPAPAPRPSSPAGPPKITAAPAAAVAGARPAVGSNPNLTAPQPGAPVSRPPASTSGSTPAYKPASSPPVRPPVAAGADGGLSDQKVKAIYDAYVMAKKRCGEDTRSVTLDSVASSLRKQVPELMKSHNARAVEFKVVIKDGKAVLRALPKE